MDIVWKFGTTTEFNNSNYDGVLRNIWKLGKELFDTKIGKSYFTQKKS